MKCPVCGKKFEETQNPNVIAKKYCSKKCRALQNQKNYWAKKINEHPQKAENQKTKEEL